MREQLLLLGALQYNLILIAIQALWGENKQKITGGIKMTTADCRLDTQINTL